LGRIKTLSALGKLRIDITYGVDGVWVIRSILERETAQIES